jgi:uncharacterized SAM-binding protein YcdF (DUF218 family)
VKRFFKILRIFLLSLGSVFLVLLILAFTTLPFWSWYRLSTSKAGIHRPPDYIVILGGGGMPSETGLMRTWYGTKAAGYFTRSKIIIALPGNVSDSLSSINGMRKELILRGIAPARILLEDSGTNTRAQALNIFKILAASPPAPPLLKDKEKGSEALMSSFTRHPSLLVVTSPEHLYRAVLAFRKAGFAKVDGLPAFEEAIESDLKFDVKKLGGKRWMPDIGEDLALRYEFWTQLKYEQLVLREYIAITYYWMMGWI